MIAPYVYGILEENDKLMCLMMASSRRLPAPVAFSADGRQIAVGIGGKIAGRRVYGYKKHAGKVMVFNASTLEVDIVAHDAHEMISTIRYSVGTCLPLPVTTVHLFIFFEESQPCPTTQA